MIMEGLFSTIANGAVQITGAAILMAAATLVRAPARRKDKRRHALLDSCTLKDIGVEPGSIAWL